MIVVESLSPSVHASICKLATCGRGDIVTYTYKHISVLTKFQYRIPVKTVEPPPAGAGGLQVAGFTEI